MDNSDLVNAMVESEEFFQGKRIGINNQANSLPLYRTERMWLCKLSIEAGIILSDFAFPAILLHDHGHRIRLINVINSNV